MVDDRASERDDGDGSPEPGERAPDGEDRMNAAPDDDEWRFGVDEVSEDGVVDDRDPIEPEAVSLENAAFVLLGALVTLGVIARVVMVFAP
ncbi:DUF7312 domain-containing protein [Halostella litorea]|uniref:DUF7312 domain-containing protein n=1 Tax=Halostella litorea TaxID=2528831 RepID=UPI001F326BD7|nr:hypothetical protein [Halostella litorea]